MIKNPIIIKLLFSSVSTVHCSELPHGSSNPAAGRPVYQTVGSNQSEVSQRLRDLCVRHPCTCPFHVSPCEHGDRQLSDLRTDRTGEKSTTNESRRRAESPTAKCDDSQVTIGSAHDTRTSRKKWQDGKDERTF